MSSCKPCFGTRTQVLDAEHAVRAAVRQVERGSAGARDKLLIAKERLISARERAADHMRTHEEVAA